MINVTLKFQVPYKTIKLKSYITTTINVITNLRCWRVVRFQLWRGLVSRDRDMVPHVKTGACGCRPCLRRVWACRLQSRYVSNPWALTSSVVFLVLVQRVVAVPSQLPNANFKKLWFAQAWSSHRIETIAATQWSLRLTTFCKHLKIYKLKRQRLGLCLEPCILDCNQAHSGRFGVGSRVVSMRWNSVGEKMHCGKSDSYLELRHLVLSASFVSGHMCQCQFIACRVINASRVAVFSEPYTARVSVFQKVAPVNLRALSPQEMVRFLVGYVADVSAFAHVNLWHDCHIGNLLMHTEPSKMIRPFYWHDFGGASSSTHSPRPQVLGEFARKIRETISEIQKSSSCQHSRLTIDSQACFWRQWRWAFADASSFIHCWCAQPCDRMEWGRELRRQALLSLHRVLSRSRYYELELILAEGDSS